MIQATFRTFLILVACVLAAPIVTSALLAAEPSTPAEPNADLAVATFGAGCFWCTESDFDKLDGVVSTVSGFMGGKTKNPTYEEVSGGGTGHTEVVQITYDPKKVGYERLLQHFWRNVDLVDGDGQFCDRGDQYRPAIFTHTVDQNKQAEASKASLTQSGRFERPIAVVIVAASNFTEAEAHHQNYYKRNPLRYRYYRWNCGRDKRLKELWGADAG
jgi:methionine-S-sulfoxide reductase